MSARAVVLRGIFSAANTGSVGFLDGTEQVFDDFDGPWSQLAPKVREGWERAASLLAVTPPELLVPRDSPLLSSAPPPPRTCRKCGAPWTATTGAEPCGAGGTCEIGGIE